MMNRILPRLFDRRRCRARAQLEISSSIRVWVSAIQVGGAYDLAQSAARLAGVAAEAGQKPASDLPEWQLDPGGYPPQYPMEYGNRQPPLQPNPPESPYARYPPYENWGQVPAPAAEVDVKGAVGGMARMGVGTLKMVPVLGNLLNGVDFVRDFGRSMPPVPDWAQPAYQPAPWASLPAWAPANQGYPPLAEAY